MSPTDASATKREIQVEIPAEDVARETLTIIEKYQKLARIPGFRRGHVPASVIRQRFREDLKSDVVEALVPRYFRREADKLGLRPVSQPQVSELHVHDNEPLRFKASFEVMPEVKVEGYKDLRSEKKEVTVTDDEVQQTLMDCASSRQPIPRSMAVRCRKVTSPKPPSTASPRMVMPIPSRAHGRGFD